MPNGHVLELSSLPTIHPRVGQALLLQCAASAIVRLSLDPTRLLSGTMSREVCVSWLARPGTGPAADVRRTIGWSDLLNYSGDVVVQWCAAVPAQDITEQAAIAVMALLLHDLAQGEIIRVLPIGSGGDYSVQVRGLKRSIQSECSGIHADETGHKSRTRLGQKKVQVLKKSRAGFASVTAFSHPPDGVVQSFLHYVRRRMRRRRR
jgi:hypothetical protein